MAGRRKHDLARAIESALTPGVYVGYRDSWSFVENLEAIRAKIMPLIEAGDKRGATRAVALLETFIGGCYEKSEEIDDSGGSFGQFVETLFCDWVRARRAAGADATETAEVLLSQMENDDYGYCHRLEKEAVKVLDRAGLAAFEKAVLNQPISGDGPPREQSYARHRRVEILKAIYEARRDVDAYATLCENEGGLAPADCEVLAQLCLGRRRPEDALAWVERGLDLEKRGHWPNRSSWRLPDLEREILKKLGRRGDALASAWQDYRRAPSVYSYEELMKFVAKGERVQWHAKAMAALDGADLSSRIDLLLKTKEWAQLAEVIDAASRERLVKLSHYTSEPAAKRLERSHPLLAAKLQVAMALRILEAKKSKYYDAALANLERARKLLLRQGPAGERQWVALAAEIRSAHRRKTGFMPGFERLAEGRLAREPSFRERARRRWSHWANGGRGES